MPSRAHPDELEERERHQRAEQAAEHDLERGVDARLDARLRDEQRQDERDRRDEEAVVRAGDVGQRDPAGEGDGGVARGETAAQRGAAARQRLDPDHDDDGDHERDERQLGGSVPDPVEQPGGAGRRRVPEKTR